MEEIKQTTKSNEGDFSTVIDDLLGNPYPRPSNVESIYMASGGSKVEAFNEAFLTKVKEKYQISDEFMDKVRMVINQHTVDDGEKVYNLANIQNIAIYFKSFSKEKGNAALQEMFDEFGIVNGNKYPLEALIKQYEQKYTSGEYYVFVQSLVDHNGTSYNDEFKHMVKRVIDFVDKKQAMLRFFELTDLANSSRRAKLATDTYGEHKVLGGVLYGHGSNRGYVINAEERVSANAPLSEDALKEIQELFRKFFNHDAEVLQLSCLADHGENSIAEFFAKVTGVDRYFTTDSSMPTFPFPVGRGVNTESLAANFVVGNENNPDSMKPLVKVNF